jgi:WXG100 family type VII secretion target
MTDEIRADYDQLEQVAGTFANQAQTVQGILQQVLGRYEDLENGGWIGMGADAFFTEMRGEVLPAVQRLIDALIEGGGATRDVAQVIKSAEQEASSRFRM